MLNRSEIRNLILDIEENYGVTEWRHNGYHVWPVFRIFLYLNLIKKKEERSSGSEKKNRSIFSKARKLLLAFKELILISFRNANKIYIGSPSHCVDYNGFKYNRYFDPIMDNDESTSLYFSKSESKRGVYKPERQFLIIPILTVFGKINKLFSSNSTPNDYIQELCEILELKGVNIEGFGKTLKRKIRTVDVSCKMFQFLFKKFQPEEVWVLCYYSADMMGMLIAAHKLSISTIDMQHGGQGENHLAYNNWSNVPKKGYEALPNSFYTWDKFSKDTINYWANDNYKHSAELFGNPWVEGWKQKTFSSNYDKWPNNLILLTLQPTINPLDDYILDTIKRTSQHWDWWIRIHPRQFSQKEMILKKLKDYHIYESVNFELASSLQLPEILAYTKVHLTKFSGSAIEAFEFGVPTIVIDELGVETFKDYIENKNSMVAMTEKDPFELIETIEKIL